MKHLFLSALILMGVTSCQISGLTSGYSHLSDAQKKRVITLEENIDDIHDFSKIYKVGISDKKRPKMGLFCSYMTKRDLKYLISLYLQGE